MDAPGDVAAALQSALRRDADATLDAIGAPDVLPLLLARSGLDDAVPNLLGLIHEEVYWNRPVARVMLRNGVARFDPPARRLAIIGGRLEAELADGSVAPVREDEQTAFAITPTVHLSLIDTNPLQDVEEHPDKSGNRLDLGSRTADEWVTALRGAIGLIAAGLPEWAAELEVSLQRIIPVGYEPEQHLSASYREAPGIAYLTLHPDPLTLAEAIIHETQHTKLNLLRWLDPVLSNGETFWTSSPVRPDLRPLIGVLMAVHAFVPVAALHERLATLDHPITRSARFALRRREVLASNARGFAVLDESAQSTAAGRRLLADLHALDHELQRGMSVEQGDFV